MNGSSLQRIEARIMPQQPVAKVTEVVEAVILELQASRLDSDSTAQMGRDLMAAAAQYPGKPIIFDIGKLEFIRSTEIGSFVEISKRFRSASRTFSLAGMKTAVRATFHVSRIDQVVKVYESVYDALAEV
jgi:anti-anti-sigma factor